ncbi:hypothetical protein Back11_34010 [Paenibacillus baekrokdamisoli]|uniref:Transposase DDE domain-containing protein n=1 Tax=Paenibacillus baekrokdamisoli TaxID=1712516 RepID=A0A3G9IUH8_9BACL|nr:hypothetical protein [Paenibacillus baekrokdamisoli]BBH22056.1 hypothetical protein Back11_34010 [Paenibacillus baekrokdamisoli]
MSTKFTLETSSDYLTSRAGLILVGQLLADTHLNKQLNLSSVGDTNVPTISHADNVRAYLGLLCQGKSDFDHIEPLRKDVFFSTALGIRKLTFSPTLRQRFDQAAPLGQWQKIVLEESADLLKRARAPLTPVQITFDHDEQKAYLQLKLFAGRMVFIEGNDLLLRARKGCPEQGHFNFRNEQQLSISLRCSLGNLVNELNRLNKPFRLNRHRSEIDFPTRTGFFTTPLTLCELEPMLGFIFTWVSLDAFTDT